MQADIVIATKGRAPQVWTLLDSLAAQTLAPRHIVVVGASEADVAGLGRHPLSIRNIAKVQISDRPGLTTQRNIGVTALQSEAGAIEDSGFITFFDDDFRPAPDWLERCAEVFKDPAIMGVTGQVLADGVKGEAISETDAIRYIRGELPRQPHWASEPAPRDVGSMYGCNMAFRADVLRQFRFDEALPLYGWQEDLDFTAQARTLGRTIYSPLPRGVHLGVKGGRVSGVRFGYSQIANPIYLARKGTMDSATMRRFVMRAAAANVIRSISNASATDYRGRLRGNFTALLDLARGRCAPQRITELG